MKARTIIILSILICTLSACGKDTGNNIVVAGSTSVQPYAEVLSEDYMAENPGDTINVQGGGSAAGISAAESGTADIGTSSRDLTPDEASKLHSFQIAVDGLAIVINPRNPLITPDNPVPDLTLEQVRGIYSAQITNWSELGGTNAKIHVITREEGSGTRSSFEELVMGKDTYITPKAIVQDSNGAVRQLVTDDPDCIGFISLGLVESSGYAPVVAIKLGGIEATRENIVNGSYKLFRPFLFVTNNEPEGLVKQFIDYTLSPTGQQILSNEGLIPE